MLNREMNSAESLWWLIHGSAPSAPPSDTCWAADHYTSLQEVLAYCNGIEPELSAYSSQGVACPIADGHFLDFLVGRLPHSTLNTVPSQNLANTGSTDAVTLANLLPRLTGFVGVYYLGDIRLTEFPSWITLRHKQNGCGWRSIEMLLQYQSILCMACQECHHTHRARTPAKDSVEAVRDLPEFAVLLDVDLGDELYYE